MGSFVTSYSGTDCCLGGQIKSFSNCNLADKLASLPNVKTPPGLRGAQDGGNYLICSSLILRLLAICRDYT
jgi:hypothetical protein